MRECLFAPLAPPSPPLSCLHDGHPEVVEQPLAVLVGGMLQTGDVHLNRPRLPYTLPLLPYTVPLPLLRCGLLRCDLLCCGSLSMLR